MTQWFTPTVYEGYEWLEVDDDRWGHAFVDPDADAQAFDGLRVRLVRELGDYALEPSDFPWMGSHALAVRPRARAAIEPLVGAAGEFCAVSCPGAELDVLAVKAAGVLHEGSSAITLDASGVPKSFMGVVLREDLLQGRDFVRLPFWASPIYVNERVVEVYDRAGLSGLRFDPIPTSS